jgi:bifunctional non-homologous end joining protein LigD
MPLAWEQVKAGLDLGALHDPHRRALLAKSGAWKDYGAGTRPVADALKRLTGSRKVA